MLGEFAGESVGVEVLFSVEPLGLINGSARTDEGLSAKAERVASSWFISSCRWMMRPPALHWDACSTEKVAPHPSHLDGRLARVRP